MIEYVGEELVPATAAHLGRPRQLPPTIHRPAALLIVGPAAAHPDGLLRTSRLHELAVVGGGGCKTRSLSSPCPFGQGRICKNVFSFLSPSDHPSSVMDDLQREGPSRWSRSRKKTTDYYDTREGYIKRAAHSHTI